MVHHAEGALATRALLPLLAAAALILSGCLGGGSENTAPGAGARLGAPVRLANCGDWNRGTIRERQGTIEEIKAFAGSPIGKNGSHGATLPDGKAYDLFEGYCKQGFAHGFKLYKLYTRAAGFTQQ